MAVLNPMKRGDTFFMYIQYPEAVSVDQFRCQIRDGTGNLIDTPIITLQTDPTQIKVLVADTTTWPIAQLQMDVERAADGIILSSETIYIPVIKDVTH